jgi:hypothetical protein
MRPRGFESLSSAKTPGKRSFCRNRRHETLLAILCHRLCTFASLNRRMKIYKLMGPQELTTPARWSDTCSDKVGLV